MPYYTTNPAYGQAANNLVRAFTSKPEPMDLNPYKAQQIQQQMVTESIQQDKLRTQISDLSKQIQGRDSLAALYEGYGARVGSYQGPTQEGQSRMEAFGPQAYDAMVPNIAGSMVRSGFKNPSMATLGSMMPGLSDEQRARNYMGAGKAIGKDDFFSMEDRDDNAVYNVAGGSRAVRGDGSTVVDIAPAFLDAQDALSEQRRAMAAKSLDPRLGASGAGKVPRLGSPEVKMVLGTLAQNFGYGDGQEMLSDLDPSVASQLYQSIADAWAQSGGNTMAAAKAGLELLGQVPTPPEAKWYQSNPRRFQGAKLPQATPSAAPPAAPAPPPISRDEAIMELRRRGVIQ